MPRDPTREDVIKQPRAEADKAVLRRLADLISDVGFSSPEIIASNIAVFTYTLT